MTDDERMFAIEPGAHVCPPPPPRSLPLAEQVHPGFGVARLVRDGTTVALLSEGATGHVAEDRAAREPGHRWTLVIEGPLSGATYLREGEGNWVVIETNGGFA